MQVDRWGRGSVLKTIIAFYEIYLYFPDAAQQSLFVCTARPTGNNAYPLEKNQGRSRDGNCCMAFRDAEGALIALMMKEEYSGGGTIQSNIATHNYTMLIIERTNAIFNYYITIVKNKQP